MSLFLFDLLQTLAFFGIMLFAVLVSILCAKSTIGVVIYIAAVVTQFISLVNCANFFEHNKLVAYWVIFICIVLVGFIVICVRRHDEW